MVEAGSNGQSLCHTLFRGHTSIRCRLHRLRQMSARKRSRTERHLVLAFQIAVALGILTFLFHDSAKRAQMAEALRRADWWWLLAGVFAYGATETLGAIQWQFLLRIQSALTRPLSHAGSCRRADWRARIHYSSPLGLARRCGVSLLSDAARFCKVTTFLGCRVNYVEPHGD